MFKMHIVHWKVKNNMTEIFDEIVNAVEQAKAIL